MHETQHGGGWRQGTGALTGRPHAAHLLQPLQLALRCRRLGLRPLGHVHQPRNELLLAGQLRGLLPKPGLHLRAQLLQQRAAGLLLVLLQLLRRGQDGPAAAVDLRFQQRALLLLRVQPACESTGMAPR